MKVDIKISFDWQKYTKGVTRAAMEENESMYKPTMLGTQLIK